MAGVKQKIYIATVPTYHETMAVADTEEKAVRLALTRALKYLKDTKTDQYYTYKTCRDVDEQLGFHVTEMEMNTAVIGQ